MLIACLVAFAVPPRLDLARQAIYQVNLRAFGPEKGFVAVRKQLPKIKNLGTSIVWLMPIHPVGKIRLKGALGSPYAVQDYFATNPEFGTSQDFRQLVDAAHRLGLKVIIDWVANHTAWDHPWMKNRDWYAQDKNGNVIMPPGTNWDDVAELNFESAAMRKEMHRAMEHWVREFKIDGFRCDYAEGVPNEFWISTIGSLRKNAGKPILMLAEAAREDLVKNVGFDLLYDWGLFGLLKDIYLGKKPATAFVPAAREPAVPRLRFITNHDESAWNGSVPKDFGSVQGGLGAYQALAFTGGVPLIFSSQEIGYEGQLPFFSATKLDWTSGKSIRQAYEAVGRDFRALARGLAPTLTDLSTKEVIAFEVSSSPGKRLLVIVNTTNKPAELQHATAGKIALSPLQSKRIWLKPGS